MSKIKEIEDVKNAEIMDKLLDKGVMLGALADPETYKTSNNGAPKPKPVTDEYLQLLISEYNAVQNKTSTLSRRQRDLVESQVNYFVSIELLKFDTEASDTPPSKEI